MKSLGEGDPVADGWMSAASMGPRREPERIAEKAILEGSITKALEELPEEFRTVLLLADVEGLTLSGGEPMQQASALFALISILKARRPDLSIGMYSGYTERELNASAIWRAVCEHLDFAVLGRFVAAKPSSLPLRTSANQILRLFSGRYREEDFQPQECEVQITQDGLVQITGFPLAGSPA